MAKIIDLNPDLVSHNGSKILEDFVLPVVLGIVVIVMTVFFMALIASVTWLECVFAVVIVDELG